MPASTSCCYNNTFSTRLLRADYIHFGNKCATMGSENHQITIGILSLVRDETIDNQFIPMLNLPKIKFRFVQLKPMDLHVFSPPSDLHAVILLHPFPEGRLSLTDVTDARYTKLLPTLSSHFGSQGVCVIAYLLQNLKESTEVTHLNIVKQNQPTVFEMASCVILCGKLEDMFKQNIHKIQEFTKVIVKKRRASPRHKPLQEEFRTKTRYCNDEGYRDDAFSGGIEGAISDERDEDLSMENGNPTVVLVTDASGFIGSHIIHQLTLNGYKVRGALDLEKGTLDRFEKGTLENMSIRREVGMLKGLFPELDLFEAGIHHNGWKKAVTGCSHVIHTSRFQDDRPAKEDDVTNFLQECKVGGIQQVILTGGQEEMSDNELRNEEWTSVNTNLKDAICKHVSEEAALKFMGFQREEELLDNEWKSMNSVLKDASYKYVSEKAAIKFMTRQQDLSEFKPPFGLNIIHQPPVVLGPILCEKAEANVEFVRQRIENTASGQSDNCISVCDVRDVAETHIEAMRFTHTVGIQHRVVFTQSLSLKDMSAILKREFKDHGDWDWDETSQCLQDLQGNRTESNQDMDSGIKKSVIDMAYSCMERGLISKMPGDRQREQEKRYREEKTCASSVQGADNANPDQRNGSRIWRWLWPFLVGIFLLFLVGLFFGDRGRDTELLVTVPTSREPVPMGSVRSYHESNTILTQKENITRDTELLVTAPTTREPFPMCSVRCYHESITILIQKENITLGIKYNEIGITISTFCSIHYQQCANQKFSSISDIRFQFTNQISIIPDNHFSSVQLLRKRNPLILWGFPLVGIYIVEKGKNG